MKLNDLEAKLLSEGCNRNSFEIGGRKSADDAFCVAYQNSRWEIFYTERGHDSPPIFTSQSEEEACDYFYRYMLEQPHWHLLGWLDDETEAIELETRIRALGIKPVRNDIPAPKFGKPTFRIFVMGKDVFCALKALPELPIIKDKNYPLMALPGLKLGIMRNLSALLSAR